jgi:ribosome modulation factor
MNLGDMEVVGDPPAKLVKALAAVASDLHPAFDGVLRNAGKSKESCVLSSLAVRDFFWKIGFKDARATTVYLVLQALDAEGNEIHSIGVGDHVPVQSRFGRPLPLDTADRWSGHMVVTVPSAGYLIDTTLFHMRRPAWPDLPGMIAAPIERTGQQTFGLDHLAYVGARSPDDGLLRLAWLEQDNERWRGSPDTQRDRRDPVVRAMRRAFGNWA